MVTKKIVSESIVWTGQPSVFGGLEVEPPGTITYVFDEVLNTNVWRYFKPSDVTSYRCESRNIRVNGAAYKWQKNKTYQIKWKSKLTKIDSDYGDFIIFQWKSYPNGQQNYPIIISAVKDEVRFIYVDPDGKWNTLWTQKTLDGEWNSYCLTLHLSDVSQEGWFELKYNDVLQELAGQRTFYGRTLDGSNEPKWGAYNRDNPGHEIEQFVGDLEVGLIE